MSPSADSEPTFDGRVVITGGAGLVGQNLVTRLGRQAPIVVIDKHARNLSTLARLHPHVVCEQADLASSGGWTRHFAGAAAVVMLQAQIGALDAEAFVRNNVESTERVLAAVREHAVPYLVHVSSSVIESVADDAYTRTKRRQEELVLQSGVRSVILRPTLMFGWFDRKHLGWLARFMRKSPVFPIPGNGRFERQPLYAGDFCEIVIRCLARRQQGRYNISGMERIDYVDLIRAIRRVTGARTALVRIPFGLFDVLLKLWARFDRDPPFTSAQLHALAAGDTFEVIDWPRLFAVTSTPLAQALQETFTHPVYNRVELAF